MMTYYKKLFTNMRISVKYNLYCYCGDQEDVENVMEDPMPVDF